MMIVEKEKSAIKRRTKGEKTKRQILNATIAVLAKNGIKGTTHRAIAKSAEIQLSLTTYYFKDIDELILQAMSLNCQNITSLLPLTWSHIFQLINRQNKTDLIQTTSTTTLIAEISEQLTEKIIDAINNNSDALSVEQTLLTHTHINSSFTPLADTHKANLISPYINLFSFFNTKTAQLNAELLFNQIKQLEYFYLNKVITADEKQHIHQLISHFLSLSIT